MMSFISQQLPNFPTDLLLNFFVPHLPVKQYHPLSCGRRTKVPTLTGSVAHKQLLAVAMYTVKGNLQQQSSIRSNILTGAYLDKLIFSCQTHRVSLSLNDNNWYRCSLSPAWREHLIHPSCSYTD